MSAFQGTLGTESRRWQGPPRYSGVLRGTLYGQVLGSIVLWGASFVLMLLKLVGESSRSADAIYLPWQIAGAWSLVAAVGWGTLVAMLIGTAVRLGVERSTGVTPAWGWCVLAVAAGGYVSLVFAPTSAAGLLMAVVLTPALLSVLAFESSGPARPFPGTQAVPGVGRIGLLASISLLLAAPYSVLHQFVGNGSGLEAGASSYGVYALKAGHSVRLSEGLSDGSWRDRDGRAPTDVHPGTANIRHRRRA